MFDTFTKKCTRNYTAAYTIDVVDDVYEIQFLGDPDLDVVDDVMRFSFLVILT